MDIFPAHAATVGLAGAIAGALATGFYLIPQVGLTRSFLLAASINAIVGITDEGAEIMKEYKGSPALDSGLLAAAQAVEHYEISRYGTLIAWAEELGVEDAVSLLEETL